LWDQDIWRASRADALRGLEIARRNRLHLAEIHLLRRLSPVVAYEGEWEEGVAFGERAVAIAAELFGGSHYELTAIQNLAFVYGLAGRYKQAVEASVHSIELSRELGSIREEAISYGVLGDAYRGLGDYRASIETLQRALPLLRSHHADRLTGLCLLKLGYGYEGTGQFIEAVRYLEQARDLFEAIGLEHKLELARQALGRCQAALPSVPNK
jgi:tetratricopeptide (TPR) repeat protein